MEITTGFKLNQEDLPQILKWLAEDIEEARIALATKKTVLLQNSAKISYMPETLKDILVLETFLEVAEEFQAKNDSEKESYIKEKLIDLLRGSNSFNSTCLMINVLNQYSIKGIHKFLQLFL